MFPRSIRPIAPDGCETIPMGLRRLPIIFRVVEELLHLPVAQQVGLASFVRGEKR